MSNVPLHIQVQRAQLALRKYVENMEGVMRTMLYQAGEEIITDVRASRPGRGVPRDTGVLANSLRVLPRNDTQVDLVAGGAAAPYALVQHERMDYKHKLGEPRYLIRGVERWKPGGSAAMQALRQNAEFAAKRAAGEV